MSKATARILVSLALFIFIPGTGFLTGAFAQGTPFFTPGNLIVSVEGNGVVGESGTYADNQAAPLTLLQFTLNPSNPTTVPAQFVDSLVLPQTGSGANVAVSGEYGSSSEGALHLAGSSQYLTIMGYGVNAAAFNANPGSFSTVSTNTALGQSGSQTGQGYTAVPRATALIDPYGNVNSSTAIFNIFNANNPRSTYTVDGTHIYVSGQGTSGDATGGTFYTTLGSGSATSITGTDGGSGAAQDTRDVQIFNNTLYVSLDSKSGATNRSYIGTMGTPPATTLYNSSNGPTQLTTANSSAVAVTSTGKLTLTAGETNGVNSTGLQINLSPENYFFASSSVLYVADSGGGKQTSATSCLGDGGLQKWVNTKSNGTGTWELQYTLAAGLNLVVNSTCNPSNTDGTTGLIGLTGVVVGSNVELFATNFTIADLDPTYIYAITDVLAATTNPGTSFTQIAAAPADSNFKGVAFAPTLPAGSATITTTPSGLTVSTSGTGCAAGTYTTPVTLLWTPASSCSLSVVSTETVGGGQYLFNQWSDGTTGTTDSVTAPSTAAVYNASFTQATPGLYNPAKGSTFAGTSATFQWYGFPGATAYWLDVGKENGGDEYYQSGSVSNGTFSQAVNSLPNDGSAVVATWYYLLNGAWTATYYSYTASGGSSSKGVITSPAPGSTFTGSSATFVWSAGSDASAYWIDVGNVAGGDQYYQSGNLGNVLTKTVSGLPTNGSTVYVTLYSLVNGSWLNNVYMYTAYSLAAAGGTLTTPMPGSVLTSGTVTFDWTAGAGASAYWLDVGNVAGGDQYYQSGNLGGALTTTVSGLPTDGSTIYATLYSLIGGQWTSNAYSYTALNATGGLATIQTPTPGTTLSGTAATFTWSTDSNATAYWLDIGTEAGGDEYYQSGNLGNVTTTSVNNLPANGSTIYATLYSYVGGQWLSNSVTYVSGP
jgi:hypothetical protein